MLKYNIWRIEFTKTVIMANSYVYKFDHEISKIAKEIIKTLRAAKKAVFSGSMLFVVLEVP